MPREPGTPWPEKAREQHERFQRATTDATKQKAVNRINKILGRSYTIETLPEHPVDPWEDEELIALHRQWWDLRIARQKEIDASIAANADFEYLYDRPYEDSKKVRVAEARGGFGGQDFPSLILEALRKAGVQQAHKEDRITFDTLTPWPGETVAGRIRVRRRHLRGGGNRQRAAGRHLHRP